jgi:general stress protein CsbA
MENKKEYKIRKWVGIPVAIFAAWIFYHFVLIGFFVKTGWISKGWAIFIAVIVFMAGYGYWIEHSNKSQFYDTHKDGMKIHKS